MINSIMRRAILVLLFGAAIVLAQLLWFPIEVQSSQKGKTTSKGLKKGSSKGPTKTASPESEERYDPENLGSSEVACGRIGSKKAPPCGCMKHRIAIRDEAVQKCDFIEDRQKRMECFIAVPQCPDVTDRDHPAHDAAGNQMPPQCKRWCSKARCECCTS